MSHLLLIHSLQTVMPMRMTTVKFVNNKCQWISTQNTSVAFHGQQGRMVEADCTANSYVQQLM